MSDHSSASRNLINGQRILRRSCLKREGSGKLSIRADVFFSLANDSKAATLCKPPLVYLQDFLAFLNVQETMAPPRPANFATDNAFSKKSGLTPPSNSWHVSGIDSGG